MSVLRVMFAVSMIAVVMMTALVRGMVATSGAVPPGRARLEGSVIRATDTTRGLSPRREQNQVDNQIAPDDLAPLVPVIQAPAQVVRFETVDIYIDAGDKPLAAYQFSVHSATKTALLAGLEGGEHPSFAHPPYYDPKALIDEKVIVAAYSTADTLPQGRTRVARLHVQVSGEKNPEYVATLQTAAAADGSIIPAKLTVETTVR